MGACITAEDQGQSQNNTKSEQEDLTSYISIVPWKKDEYDDSNQANTLNFGKQQDSKTNYDEIHSQFSQQKMLQSQLKVKKPSASLPIESIPITTIESQIRQSTISTSFRLPLGQCNQLSRSKYELDPNFKKGQNKSRVQNQRNPIF